MTETAPGVDHALTRPADPRRTIARIAGGTFAIASCVVIAVLSVEEGSSGTASVLIGPFDGTSLMRFSMFLALLALTVGIWSIGVPRWMLPLTILCGIAGAGASALAGLTFMMTSDASVTPLLHRGCETGYVAVERSFLLLSSGTIYRHDGPFVVTEVGHSSGDDGYQPFASGTYAVTEKDGAWLVRHAIDSSGLEAGGVSPITLPILTDSARSCGSSDETGLRPPPHPVPPPEPLSAEEIDASIRELVAASFDSASGTVRDADGIPLDADLLVSANFSCSDVPGMRRELALDFRTEDNARSLTAILAVWDAAGYATDRAMQEDIRYSEELPVSRMSIRDKTSIDGMLHMTITSACVTGE